MNINRAFSDDFLKTIKERSLQTSVEVKRITQELNTAEHAQQVWDNLVLYMKNNWPQHILHLFKKETQFFKNVSAENNLVKQVLDEIYQIAKETANIIQKRFPAYIEEAFAEKKIPLDRDSRDPKYTIEKGFFVIEVDHQSGIAHLDDYEGRLDEFPADIGAIVEIVQREHNRVFGKLFDGVTFLRKLRNQYMAIIKKENWSDGYSIPIRRITHRLGKNEKGFRTDVFIIQLSRLIEKGPTEIDGRRLDLQQTKDTNQGIHLHGIAGRGYIGYITFKEV